MISPNHTRGLYIARSKNPKETKNYVKIQYKTSKMFATMNDVKQGCVLSQLPKTQKNLEYEDESANE